MIVGKEENVLGKAPDGGIHFHQIVILQVWIESVPFEASVKYISKFSCLMD
jgi:hypothetical protein